MITTYSIVFILSYKKNNSPVHTKQLLPNSCSILFSLLIMRELTNYNCIIYIYIYLHHYQVRKPWLNLLENCHEMYWYWRKLQFHQSVFLKVNILYIFFCVPNYVTFNSTVVCIILVLSTETNYMIIVVYFYTNIKRTGV